MARGSITKRGEAWRLCVELPPDPETGNRRQKWETFTGTKKEADRRLNELQRLADSNQLGVNPRMTTGEYLESWLRDYAGTRSPKTQDSYRLYLTRHVMPHLGMVPLAKLAPAHVVRLLTNLRDAPRADGRGALSPSTVHAVYRTLRTALNTAVRWQLIPRSPLVGVEAPRVPRKEMECFDLAQAQRFLKESAAEGLKWEAFFATLLQTGCRPGELKAARWSDLDFGAGTLHIGRHVQRLPGKGFVVGDTKTNKSRRTIALGTELLAMLRRHRAEQAVERLRLGSLWERLDLIFPSEIGSFLESARVHRVFRRICERADLPRIRVYDLRHTSATILLGNGVDLKTVSDRLGHANATLVLTTYGHTLPGAQAAASEAFEALIRKAQ